MANTWKRSKKDQGPKKYARRLGALKRLEDNEKDPHFQSGDKELQKRIEARRAREMGVLRHRLGIAA